MWNKGLAFSPIRSPYGEYSLLFILVNPPNQFEDFTLDFGNHLKVQHGKVIVHGTPVNGLADLPDAFLESDIGPACREADGGNAFIVERQCVTRWHHPFLATWQAFCLLAIHGIQIDCVKASTDIEIDTGPQTMIHIFQVFPGTCLARFFTVGEHDFHVVRKNLKHLQDDNNSSFFLMLMPLSL